MFVHDVVFLCCLNSHVLCCVGVFVVALVCVVVLCFVFVLFVFCLNEVLSLYFWRFVLLLCC